MYVKPEESAILEELHEDEAELHKDEEELHADEKRITIVFILIAIFILVVVSGAYYFIRSIQTQIAKSPAETTANVIQPTVSATPTSLPSSPTPSLTTKTTHESAAKDYYINVGFGTNQSSDWTDVFGATTTTDLGQYQNIKEVHFEAFINVPTANGTVSVRLYNETDKHPVWNSEITRVGTADTYQFISPAISYDTGPKLYQVQMKSQLNVVTNLVQSRIHIVTK